MARIALISPDQDYGDRLRSVGRVVDATVVQPPVGINVPEAGLAAVLANAPGVVVVGPDVPIDRARAWTEALDELRPDIPVVWAIEPEPETWRVALLAGARDVIGAAATDDELVAALRRALAIRDRREEALHVGSSSDLLGAGSGGRLIVVVSPKGGSGKTMLSTNLAWGLNEVSGGSVALVDLDLQFGDVATSLQLRPEYSVLNGLKVAGDPTAVKAFLTPHPSGFHVMAAPNNPAEADNIDYDSLAKLLDLLRAEFDYVVVDTGAGIDEATLCALDRATDVAFVTTTDLAAIQALRKAVVVMDQLELTAHRRWYVLNRADARVGLAQSDIERSTGLTIDVALPSSRSVPTSMNQGRTVFEDDPRSAMGRALRNAVELFVGRSAMKAPRQETGGLLGRWIGKGTQ